MNDLTQLARRDFAGAVSAFPISLKALFLSSLLLVLGSTAVIAQDEQQTLAHWSTDAPATAQEQVERSEVEPAARLLPISEQNIAALDSRISVPMQAGTVETALKRIAAEAGLRLSYGSATVNVDKNVVLQSESARVRDLLQEVVSGTGLEILASSRGQLIVKERGVQAAIQVPVEAARLQLTSTTRAPLLRATSERRTGTITGVVVDDADGQPIPGANVIIAGTQQGASTDVTGRYTISGLEPGVYDLRASFMGYEPETREGVQVEDGEATTVDFSLVASTALLEELVVVGYGTQRREDLTGSVASVSAADLSDAVATTVDQALQGRVAGAMVVRNTGRPGGDVSIQIRGLGTLNAGSAEPLYVIDGVPFSGASADGITNPLALLNPQDIQSIDVLKDASAAAIYGSRASNGVVMITTKRGVAGEMRVDYNASAGMQQLPRRVDVMNLQEFAHFVTDRAEIIGYNNRPSLSNPDLLGTGTDWQRALFRDAYMTDHTLAVSGGDEHTQFRISGGYVYQDGIAIESNFNRYSLRLNLDNNTTDWLSVGTSLNLSRTTENLSIGNEDLINIAIRQTPNIPLRTPDGSWGGPDQSEFTFDNPVGLARLNTNEQARAQAVGGVYANVHLSDNITLHNEVNGTLSFTNNYVFNPTYQFGARSSDFNQSSRQASNGLFWQVRNYLDHRNSYGSFNINAMGGHEVQVNRWEGLAGSRQSFPGNSIHELGAGDAQTANNNSWAGSHSMQSFYGRLNVAYDDRYLATVNFRADASSNFDTQNRWGYFPSLSAAWRVSNESFMQGADFLDELRIRGGYGQVGNQDIGGYLFGDTYTVIPTEWGSGVRVANLGNPALQWETTESLDLGLDISILNDRVSLTADLYQQRVANLLLGVPLPLFAGTSGTGSINNPFANIGSMQNRGIELLLRTVNLAGDLRWESNFVFSRNRNQVTSLRGEGDFIDRQIDWFDTATRTVVGQPAGMFYGYVVDGIIQNEEDLRNSALPEGSSIHETQGVWVGDVKFRDLNGDGVINEQDRTFIGDPTPVFQYGITNRFSYSDFDVSVFVNGSYGNDILNQVRRQSEDPAGDHGMLRSVSEYARLGLIDPDGPRELSNLQVINSGTTVPRITESDPNNNQRISDRFIEDGSYLRIQNVTLGYRLPAELTNRFNVRTLRLFATVENLHTFTAYSGFDPEIGFVGAESAANADPLLRGVDYGRYPSPRTFTIGLNVGL